MRYHYEKPKIYLGTCGQTYICDHLVYSSCTLYLIDNKGLAVIQQRFNSDTKSTWWTEIDPWLVDSLYLNVKFKTFFEKYAGEIKDGLYPTVTVRQIMWGLKMKPIKKEPWETYFDKKGF